MFLAMVYRCFRSYLLCFEFFLEYLQVHSVLKIYGDFGAFWR